MTFKALGKSSFVRYRIFIDASDDNYRRYGYADKDYYGKWYPAAMADAYMFCTMADAVAAAGKIVKELDAQKVRVEQVIVTDIMEWVREEQDGQQV